MAYTDVAWGGDGVTYSIPAAGDTSYSTGSRVTAFLISLATNAVGVSGTQTLTNKTLTSPRIATILNGSATLTLPTTTATLSTLALAETLTNKTIDGASNTLTVRLANDVTGTLPAANGGTGVANNAANTITFSGNFGITLTLSNTTAVTLPTAGTLAAHTAGSNSDITAMTALATISTTAGVDIKGTNTNDAAATGYVGEYVSSIVSSSANFPTTIQWGDGTSISLTAGDWDVTGTCTATLNGATQQRFQCGISTTTGNASTGLNLGDNLSDTSAVPTSAADSTLTVANYRMSLNATTTVYLKVFAQYSAGQPKYYCRISARRVR